MSGVVFVSQNKKMNTTKIVLIDSFATYGFHEIFNASILLEASRTYESVVYHGTKSAILNLKKILACYNINNVSFSNLPQIHGKSIFSLLIRYLIATFLCIYLLNRNRRNKIIIMNNNPFLSVFYSLIRQKVTIFCHGELELLDTIEMGKFAKLQSCLLKKAFFKNKMKDNMTFVVLGDSILNNLGKILPKENFKRFVSMDHPYIFHESPSQVRNTNESLIKIGIVGITTLSKGLKELECLLNHPMPNICIYHIGKIADEGDLLKHKGLYIVKRDKNNNLPREEYVKWINKMDYLLYLYPPTNYRLTASGAIFESFSNLKPIISLSNDYFNYIVRKTGDIGYIFDTIDEIVHFLKDFCFNKDDYEKQINALKNGKALFSIDSQQKMFEKLIK